MVELLGIEYGDRNISILTDWTSNIVDLLLIKVDRNQQNKQTITSLDSGH
jgi:hypothetical protein